MLLHPVNKVNVRVGQIFMEAFILKPRQKEQAFNGVVVMSWVIASLEGGGKNGSVLSLRTKQGLVCV